jgi:hypothetical protein
MSKSVRNLDPMAADSAGMTLEPMILIPLMDPNVEKSFSVGCGCSSANGAGSGGECQCGSSNGAGGGQTGN